MRLDPQGGEASAKGPGFQQGKEQLERLISLEKGEEVAMPASSHLRPTQPGGEWW